MLPLIIKRQICPKYKYPAHKLYNKILINTNMLGLE